MGDSTGKHGARVDDQLERDSKDLVRGGHGTRSEDWREAEPVSAEASWDPAAGEDPATLGSSGGQVGTPPGMTAADVDERSALARLLVGVRYPARVKDLVEHASKPGETTAAADALRSLPDREYENLADVAEELGYGREERRF
ncbi:DUF2795 domain-containing protein [Actinomadura macrotermitis]|uniref:DUF2795 domain-containing protein n=1 Tax=Actinomadura macrotermitis TaxID=2585200 RepID=A0A7K0C8D8_9ACTN|nr:DUF2795 domain-containing protein [Actinomadura macrotermitis]MQY09633.1 hypothetical protein [Actinomadura macrotermitis]